MFTQLTSVIRYIYKKLHNAGSASSANVKKFFNGNMYRFKQGKSFFKGLFGRPGSTGKTSYITQTEPNQAWEDAKIQYENTLKVARLAFKDNRQAASVLHLSERKSKKGITGWLQHAQIFYATLLTNPKLQKEIAKFGYSEKKLRFELDNIEERALGVVNLSKTAQTAKQVKKRRPSSVL